MAPVETTTTRGAQRTTRAGHARFRLRVPVMTACAVAFAGAACTLTTSLDDLASGAQGPPGSPPPDASTASDTPTDTGALDAPEADVSIDAAEAGGGPDTTAEEAPDAAPDGADAAPVDSADAADTADTADTAPTIEQACEQYAQAECDRIFACAGAFAMNALFGGTSQCRTRLRTECKLQLQATGTGATPAQALACAQAFSALGCEELLRLVWPAACGPASGSYGEGHGCWIHSQCQSAHCKLVAGELCGTCAQAAKAGGTCATDLDCAYGLVCGAGVCAQEAGKGMACSPTKPCGWGLRCANGTCADALKSGEPCDAQASPTECDLMHGLFCSPATSSCSAIQIASLGQSCGYLSGTLVMCAGGASCVPPGSGSVCTAPSIGEACDAKAATPLLCAPPGACLNGTCAMPNSYACPP
jgi:hypothetical protein